MAEIKTNEYGWTDEYSNWICQIVKENVEAKDNMLDLFSNIDYRHAVILQNQFRHIDALDQRFQNPGQDGNINRIKSLAENFNPVYQYDLITLMWPECSFNFYLFEQSLKFIKNLTPNGKMIIVYQDEERYSNDEELMSRLFNKMFLIDQKCPARIQSQIESKIEENGLTIEEKCSYYYDRQRKAFNLNLDRVNEYDDTLLSPEDKKKIAELSTSVDYYKIGWLYALVLSVKKD